MSGDFQQVDEKKADDCKEERSQQSDKKGFPSDLDDGVQSGVEANPDHGNQNEKSSQFIHVLNYPSPRGARDGEGSISDRSDHGKGQETKEKERDCFRVSGFFCKTFDRL